MAQMSNYLKDKLIDEVFRNTPYAQATHHYVALYATNPTAADIGTELSGSGYARMTVDFDAPVVDTGTSQNTDDVTFAAATGDWVEITHVGVHDAVSAGNLLSFQALSTPITVLDTNNFRIPSSQLTVVFS